ncbi:MAG: FadR family transcriptional regulator [Desulfarculus sp.]|nr:FadR family transcriptional regulator [Desulfarculus sp.]
MVAAAPKFSAIKRKKAYEQVAQTIRRQVLSGQLSLGERLPSERDLAEQFGVSRVVVREAIRTLEMSGILRVQKGAGGGTFVAAAYAKPLSGAITNLLEGGTISLDHLFELRLMLEPPAAAQVAGRAGPEQVAELEEILAQAEQVVDDSETLREINLEFHRRLAVMTGNPLLAALCETVLQLLVDSLRGNLSIETSRSVQEFHRRIVEAIRAGDPGLARQLIEGDLGQLWRRYQEMGVTGLGPRGGEPTEGTRP